MNIKNWLLRFNNAWSNHNVDEVVSLFSENVEYWETPNKLLKSREELKNEWKGIVSQNNIRLVTSLYTSSNSKHAVTWHLQYTDQEHVLHTWAGTYLITLNKEGLCTYFHHTGEKL